jgi:omega-hydroxy-beta-dihydromenaquinone-9 sulfotransferase
VNTRRTTLATSLPLRRWLKEDPAWAAQLLAWRAQQTWLAALGSLNQRLSAAALAQQGGGENKIPLQDPVFIVGPWRSGTTVMHELLVAATGCATPRTGQCMDPNAFLLPRRGREKSVTIARPMDGLAISGDSPQEDEFALLALGVESAYRAFWMPQRLYQLRHTLDPAYWLEHPQWIEPWERFLRGVLLQAGAAAKQPLILKSPNHTFRIASILQRFPNARFVWMLRDPVQVFHSNRKMWSSMFEAHGVSDARDGALDEFIANAISAAASVLQATLRNGSARRWSVVKHDDLIASPERVVERAIAQQHLVPMGDPEPLEQALQRTREGHVDRYDVPLPECAKAPCDRLALAGRELLAAATS